MPAANTRDCFSEFVGQKVVGVLFDALPVSRRDIASGTKTLVFEDGRGLTICGNGSFWIDRAEEVRRAVAARRRELRATEAQLLGVLALAGACSGCGAPYDYPPAGPCENHGTSEARAA